MKLHEYIKAHITDSGDKPDALAEKAGVSRASFFRAKGDFDVRYSIMQQIVDAVGKPLTILPGERGAANSQRRKTDGQI